MEESSRVMRTRFALLGGEKVTISTEWLWLVSRRMGHLNKDLKAKDLNT